MTHTVVTATDIADLLGELELFAESEGWTVTWNTGSQIGLSNGKNCFAAIGADGQTQPAVETDTYPTPDVTVYDGRLYGSLAKSFVGHASHYWNLPGSPVTTAGDNDRVFFNDLTGPFSEVHFFGNIDYIWIVIRSDTDRWTHLGFGTIDKKGMTHPDCAFMCGMFWRWWDNSFAGAGGGEAIKRNMDYTTGDFGNKWWFKDGYGTYHLYVPDGVLDPAYGIADDVINRINMSNMPQFRTVRGYETGVQGYADYNDCGLMNHYGFVNNKPVTGGVPLLTVPVLFGSGAGQGNSLLCFIGDIPGVRLCNISDVAIAEDLVYGAETYLPFPLKRRCGETYDGLAGTYQFGVAFKKD